MKLSDLVVAANTLQSISFKTKWMRNTVWILTALYVVVRIIGMAKSRNS